MDAKLIVNGIELKVGTELLGNITYYLSDSENNKEIFHALAGSKSANIRKEIASKDSISENTAILLLNDHDPKVLEEIIRNDIAKSIITDELIDNIISIENEDLLVQIANNYEGFENLDIEDVAKKLISLDNPTVTYAVADNYSTPKKVLKNLLKHSDPDISNAAKKSLS